MWFSRIVVSCVMLALAPCAAAATLEQLVAEALDNNPEIRAARKELDAASSRIASAGALDDPMLEAGVLNLPVSSFSFTREDMTMKMLGLSQRLPFPGKRDLRRDVASREAESVRYAYQETVNRVARDARIAYFDLALVVDTMRMTEHHRTTIRQLLKVADSRYSVGQGPQLDVLKTQTQLSKTVEDLIKLERERPVIEAELKRALGRSAVDGPIVPAVSMAHEAQLPKETPLAFEALRERALKQRPQLLSLQTMIGRSERAIELAGKDRYPDFDVRFQYGQRDSPRVTPGIDDAPRSRSDLVSVTVAMNLPIWRQTKTGPRIAEAIALHDQASSLYEAQRNETAAKLRQQIATAEQNLRIARLYANELVPQARLVTEAAMTSYQVGRGEFGILLESQMAVLHNDIARATAIASYHKALAEIEFLTGRDPYLPHIHWSKP